ncbi:MAG: DUF4276 family protein [Candidatus Paracaedibacter sp.]
MPGTVIYGPVRISRCWNNPEAINDSRETAPSKRLEKHTTYRKTTYGPNIAKEIGLSEIRQKCAGFDTWISMIESWRS